MTSTMNGEGDLPNPPEDNFIYADQGLTNIG